jgi:hypothetical protein
MHIYNMFYKNKGRSNHWIAHWSFDRRVTSSENQIACLNAAVICSSLNAGDLSVPHLVIDKMGIIVTTAHNKNDSMRYITNTYKKYLDTQ